jgi:DNA-binding response OmpR family regulator
MPAKILVLSPSSQFLRLTTLLLKQEGYLVKAESHRERAVALLNATSVDILLLDLDSPDFDAYAFLRKLQEYHIKTMPVVFTKRKKK